MVLFTKLFDRIKHPYDLKGRWYKISIENQGSPNIVSSDIECELDGVQNIAFPLKYKIIDFCVDFHELRTSSSDSAFSREIVLRKNLLGYAVKLPPAARYKTLDAYVYAVKTSYIQESPI